MTSFPIIKSGNKGGDANIFIPTVHKLLDKTPRSNDSTVHSFGEMFQDDEKFHRNYLPSIVSGKDSISNLFDGIEHFVEESTHNNSLVEGHYRDENDSRRAVHYASGALSAEASQVDSDILRTLFSDKDKRMSKIDWNLLDSQMTPYYLHNPISFSGQSRQSKSRGRSRGQSKGKTFGAMWGDANSESFDHDSDPSTLTVLAREQRIHAMHIDDQLQQAMKQYERLAEQNEKDQHEKLLLAKVVNTLFQGKANQAIHMDDIFAHHNSEMDRAAAAVAAATAAKGDAYHDSPQFLYRENSDAVRPNEAPMFRNHDQIAHHSVDAKNYWNNVPQTVDTSEETHRRSSITDAATNLTVPQKADAATQDENAENADTTTEASMHVEIASSKVRDSLRHLSKFVSSYTFRKVKCCWNLIESKFKTSTQTKTEMRIKNGLSFPTRLQALSLYTIANILCSTRAKIGPKELHDIYAKLGVPEDEVFNIRKVCALNLVIGLDPDNHLKQTLAYRLQLQVLMRTTERLVTQEELTDVLFPPDPAEREAELASIRENKHADLMAVVEEKKKKEEQKEKAQARCLILIDNFEKALGQIQFMKSKKLTIEKYEEFCDLIETCKKQIERNNNAKASQAPPDIVYYLGLDAFPPAFQESYKMKNEKPEKSTKSQAATETNASITTENLEKDMKGGSKGKQNNSSKRKSTSAKESSDSTPIVNDDSKKKEDLHHGLDGIMALPPCKITKPDFLGLRLRISGIPPPEADIDPLLLADAVPESLIPDVYVRKPSLTVPKTIEPTSKNNNGKNSSAVDKISKAVESIKLPTTANTKSGRALLKRGSVSNMSDSVASTPSLSPSKADSKTHRNLRSSPHSVMSILRETVAIGHGLSGWGYAEVVCLLQYVASSRLATMFRCFRKRWRYTAARRRWKQKESNMRCSHLLALREFTKRVQINRRYLLRQLVAWKYYTKRAKERRYIFQCCFWLFYTWRKYANKSATAKEKTRFLVGRVMPTVLLIRVFGAWKKHQQAESDRFNKSTNNYRNLIRKNGRQMLWWFKTWARKRRLIRQAWMRQGRLKYAHQLHLKKLIPFLLWRACVSYRKILRCRVGSELHEFRRQILPEDYLENPMILTSNAEKRLFKARSAGRNKGKIVNDDDGDDPKGGKKKKNKRKKKITIPSFDWKANVLSMYDVDSDGEDEEDIPAIVSDKYPMAGIAPMPVASSAVKSLTHIMLSFLANKDARVLRLVRGMYDSLCDADQWNLFEASMRFHRFAYRALNNLRIFASYKVKAKKMRARRIRAIKIIVFAEFKKIYDAGLGKANSIALSEAERINYAVRAHQIQKTTRLRAATGDIKQHLGKEEDEIDDDERAAKMMKMLNLLDPDDISYLEEQRQKRAEREREKQERIKQSGYVPPDLLEWDREDRMTEQLLAERMVQFSMQTNNNNQVVVVEADQTSNARVAKEVKTLNMLDEVLQMESDKTQMAIQRQKGFVDKFWEHAADRLLVVLAKVYQEVRLMMMKEESKIYFRSLRMPMLLSRSKSMLHRKKMVNWIRICKRLNSISNHAEFYHRKRQLWVNLNRWLKFMEIETTTATPGLGRKVRRRAEIFPDLNKSLQKDGFIKVVYCDNRRLEKSYAKPQNIFNRWKMYTQETILFEETSRKVEQKFRLQLLLKCFWALKTGLSLQENLQLIAQRKPNFPLARVDADIEQIRKRFLVNRKKGLAQVIKKYNRKFITKVRNQGKASFSFKRFIVQFKAHTQARISAEQRLLSQAFENRGSLDFKDLLFPVLTPSNSVEAGDSERERDKHMDVVMPPIMAKIVGQRFADPPCAPTSSRRHAEVEEDRIPAGFKLSRLVFGMEEHGGIAGWQLIWTADGAKDIESVKRGNWNLVGLNVLELVVPKDDFCVGLEYLYDGVKTMGVRLKLHFGGFTKWLGGKNSMSTLSISLDAEMSPRQEFEEFRAKCIGAREKVSPAMPLEVVIGLTGINTGGQPFQQRATALGLVVRKTKKHSLFSYVWVQDVLQRRQAAQALLDQAAATAAAARIASAAANQPASRTHHHHHHHHHHNDHSAGGRLLEGDSQDGSSLSPSMQSAEDSFSSSSSLVGSLRSLAAASRPPLQVPVHPQSAASRRGTSRIHSARGTGLDPADRPPSAPAAEPMLASEVQFFDVLRMRSMEIDTAFNRAEKFARALWTSKSVRDHPTLSKLVSVRIICGLAVWYFNGINRHLIGLCATESQGQALLKQAKALQHRAAGLAQRAEANRQAATTLEMAEHPWSGKSLLTPAERSQRKDCQRKVKGMREDAQRMDQESDQLASQALQVAREGELLLPRLDLSVAVVTHYQAKIAAARHKESLLESMSLDEMKTGLFGTADSSHLLSSDLMKALHSSLAEKQRMVPKDAPSLDQLVGQLLQSEQALAEEAAVRRYSLTHWGPAPTTVSERLRLKPPVPRLPRPDPSPQLQSLAQLSASQPSQTSKAKPKAALRVNTHPNLSSSASTPLLRRSSPKPGLGRVLGASLGLGSEGAAAEGSSPSRRRRKKLLLKVVPPNPQSKLLFDDADSDDSHALTLMSDGGRRK